MTPIAQPSMGEAAPAPLFDVVAVDLKTYVERVIAEGLTEKNADAIVMMAVMRRGVEDEIFKAVPARSQS